MRKMVCKICKYEWEPRVANPKKCAKCLRWINEKKPTRDQIGMAMARQLAQSVLPKEKK